MKKTTTNKPVATKTVATVKNPSKGKTMSASKQPAAPVGAPATNVVDPSKSFLEEVFVLDDPTNPKNLPSFKALAAVADVTLGPDKNGFLRAQFTIIHFTKSSKEEYHEWSYVVGGDDILNATMDGVGRQVHEIPSRGALYFVNEMAKMFEMDWNALLFEECVIEVRGGKLYSISKTGANPIIISDFLDTVSAKARIIENLYINPDLAKVREKISQLKAEVITLQAQLPSADLSAIKTVIKEMSAAFKIAESSKAEPQMLTDAKTE